MLSFLLFKHNVSDAQDRPGTVLAPWVAKTNKTLFLVLKKIDVLIKIIRLFVRSRMKASTNVCIREEEKVMSSVPTEVVRTTCREHTKAMLRDKGIC